MDAFTGAAFTGTAFAGAAYIQRCKKPAQALPCLGRPTETGSLGAGMCKCKRSAPFSTQNLDHLITQVVGWPPRQATGAATPTPTLTAQARLTLTLNHFLKLAEQRISSLPMESQDGRDRMKNEREDFHYIKNIHIQDPDPGSWIQGLGPLIPLSGSRILEPGPCTLDPGSMILLQGPRSWTLNPSFWIQNLGPRPGSSIQDHES